MNSQEIRKKIAAKIAERSKLNDACQDKDGNIRAFTEDEQKRYDNLTGEMAVLKDALTRAVATEADETLTEPVTQPTRGVRTTGPGQAPAIGTAKEDKKSYSLMRAIRAMAKHKDADQLDGLEGEVHQETIRRSHGRAFKGFAMPSTTDPEVRAMMHPRFTTADFERADSERRDLTTTTGAGSIYTVPRGFIEILRAKLVLRQLGVNVMTDMHGNFALTRQNGTNVVQWVGEEISATPTNLTFDQVLFTPKLAIATTIIDKQMMMQSSLDVDLRVENDLAAINALEFDRVAINGSGGAQPQGLLQDSTIQANSAAFGLPIGTNGGVLTYGKMIDMESAVAINNADVGKLAYLFNTTIRGQLKKQTETTAGYPVFVYSKGGIAGEGEVNTYRALVTNQVPNNLTKGSSTNCSGVIFGNWGDYTLATWDTGVDIIVDPYTGKRAGNVEITTEMAMDCHPEHETSFSVITDATPS